MKTSRISGARMLKAGLIAYTLIAASLGTEPVDAADLTVDSTADAADSNLNDGICDAGGGACTLRAAIQEANKSGVASTIAVPAGTYTLTIAGRNEEFAATGDLDVTVDTILVGAGAGQTIFRAGATPDSGIDRLFHVHEVVFALSDVSLENGKLIDAGEAGSGAGILNNGGTTVERVAIRGGRASASGGGIQTTGTATLELREALLEDNRASDGGGLSVAGGGDVKVTNTTFASNAATSTPGGAISVAGGGSLDLASSTIVGNTSSQIFGGGLSNAGTLNVESTILADNTNAMMSPGNCSGVIGSGGYNIEDSTTCNLGKPGDQNSTDPLLGPLADNGGPTSTFAVGLGSPALDAGNPAGCTVARGASLAIDQRGRHRPIDGDGNGTAICDVGAFEFQNPIFEDGFESGDDSAWM